MSTLNSPRSITYLTQQQASEYDAELMSVFSTDQLMELAGLSVATAIHEHYLHPGVGCGGAGTQRRSGPFLDGIVVCGSGNNGGDGLVAARHLLMFGSCRRVQVVYPKRTDKALYRQLMKQAELCGAVVSEVLPEYLLSDSEEHKSRRRSTLLVDAVFGYSFTGDIREPFRGILASINRIANDVTLVSVDLPSGWDVERGAQPESGALVPPHMLVSLMLPKLGVRGFYGTHYLGGRFVPKSFADKYNLVIPSFPSVSQCVDISQLRET